MAIKNTPVSLPKFSMAFQPIVNLQNRTTFAYEALVRSLNGDSACGVFEKVSAENYFPFDLACRTKGVDMAQNLGISKRGAALSVNVNPKAAIEEATHMALTCKQALSCDFPLDHLILEFVEDTEICDPRALRSAMEKYQDMGVRIAVDDFGAGYNGLRIMADLKPDIVKLDMSMVSQVDTDRSTFIIMRAMVRACAELGVMVIAEGVERIDTMNCLLDMGVLLQQGYLFGKPMFQGLPEVDFHDESKPDKSSHARLAPNILCA